MLLLTVDIVPQPDDIFVYFPLVVIPALDVQNALHLARVAGQPALWCLDGLGVASPPFALDVL